MTVKNHTRIIGKDEPKRPMGGQPGHEGFTLEPVEHPDEIVDLSIHQCTHCNYHIDQRTLRIADVRQSFDLPEVKIHVIEYRGESLVCPHCHQSVKSIFPKGITPLTSYGPNLKAVGVYLQNEQLIPAERCSEIIQDLFNISVSHATIYNWRTEGYWQLQSWDKELRDYFKKGSKDIIAHADETGFKIEKKNYWLHVLSTELFTFYGVHKKRGSAALNHFGILKGFTGKLVHDSYGSYFKCTACTHVLCNAHLIRELSFLSEELHEEWAGKMITLLSGLHDKVQEYKSKGKVGLSTWEKKQVSNQYDQILKSGFKFHAAKAAENGDNGSLSGKRGRKKQPKGKNLLDRLRQHKSAVLLFAFDFKIPFTNNLAERDLRMNKVKIKISGCFRSIHGAHEFALIRGFLSTARKHGKRIIVELRRLFESEGPMHLYPAPDTS